MGRLLKEYLQQHFRKNPEAEKILKKVRIVEYLIYRIYLASGSRFDIKTRKGNIRGANFNSGKCCQMFFEAILEFLKIYSGLIPRILELASFYKEISFDALHLILDDAFSNVSPSVFKGIYTRSVNNVIIIFIIANYKNF